MKKLLAFLFTGILVTIIGLMLSVNTTMSNASGPSGGHTGSPGDAGLTCNTTGCHTGSAITPATGWITSNIPSSGYIAGQVYTITATATYSGRVRFGFQISPQSVNGTYLGTLVNTDVTKMQIVSTKYIEHKAAGTIGTSGYHTWTFNWIAPVAGTGSVTFYGAFNCSNNNNSSSGDLIFTSNLAVIECNVVASIASSNGTTICASDSTTLNATGGTGFIWNTGATSAAIKVAAGSYSVTVTNGTGCSATSAINISTQTCPTPTGTTVTNIINTKATINWLAASCGVGYTVQYRKLGVTTWSTVTVVNPAVAVTLTGLTALTTYEFQVRTNCNASATVTSGYSAIGTFTTLCTCGKPTAITVSGITSTTATVNWTGNACAVKYRIQYRLSTATAWTTKTVTAPTATKLLTGLIANSTYQYKLRSDCNSTGSFNSGFTAIGTFNTSARMEASVVTVDRFSLFVFPNPTEGKFLLTANSQTEETAILKITNILGQQLLKQELPVVEGENNFDFNLSGVTPGIYLIEFESSEGTITKKLLLK
jgi:hypothetical protein